MICYYFKISPLEYDRIPADEVERLWVMLVEHLNVRGEEIRDAFR